MAHLLGTQEKTEIEVRYIGGVSNGEVGTERVAMFSFGESEPKPWPDCMLAMHGGFQTCYGPIKWDETDEYWFREGSTTEVERGKYVPPTEDEIEASRGEWWDVGYRPVMIETANEDGTFSYATDPSGAIEAWLVMHRFDREEMIEFPPDQESKAEAKAAQLNQRDRLHVIPKELRKRVRRFEKFSGEFDPNPGRYAYKGFEDDGWNWYSHVDSLDELDYDLERGAIDVIRDLDEDREVKFTRTVSVKFDDRD